MWLPPCNSFPEAAIYYLGIDVDKRDSQVAVLDDDGEVVEEHRFENDQFADLAEAYEGAKAALEASGNYYTIHDTLDEHLYVVVADPRQTKAIGTAEVFQERLQDYRNSKFPDIGHLPFWDAPARFNSELRGFVRALNRGRDEGRSG